MQTVNGIEECRVTGEHEGVKGFFCVLEWGHDGPHLAQNAFNDWVKIEVDV